MLKQSNPPRTYWRPAGPSMKGNWMSLSLAENAEWRPPQNRADCGGRGDARRLARESWPIFRSAGAAI